MKLGVLLFGATLMVATSALAEVNCKQVLRYLKTGRTPSEVAETMVISEADVKNCQAQAAEQAGDQGAGGEKKETGGDHAGH